MSISRPVWSLTATAPNKQIERDAVRTRVGPSNQVLGENRDPPWARARLGGFLFSSSFRDAATAPDGCHHQAVSDQRQCHHQRRQTDLPGRHLRRHHLERVRWVRNTARVLLFFIHALSSSFLLLHASIRRHRLTQLPPVTHGAE